MFNFLCDVAKSASRLVSHNALSVVLVGGMLALYYSGSAEALGAISVEDYPNVFNMDNIALLAELFNMGMNLQEHSSHFDANLAQTLMTSSGMFSPDNLSELDYHCRTFFTFLDWTVSSHDMLEQEIGMGGSSSENVFYTNLILAMSSFKIAIESGVFQDSDSILPYECLGSMGVA